MPPMASIDSAFFSAGRSSSGSESSSSKMGFRFAGGGREAIDEPFLDMLRPYDNFDIIVANSMSKMILRRSRVRARLGRNQSWTLTCADAVYERKVNSAGLLYRTLNSIVVIQRVPQELSMDFYYRRTSDV